MNISRRLVIFLFFLFLALLVGMVFWPFIQSQIIIPISQVVWVFLRIFILSIDQKYYWGAICFILAIILYRRLTPTYKQTVESGDFQNSNSTIRNIGYWRDLFTFIDQTDLSVKTLKLELAGLLLSLYAVKQRKSADFHLYDAIKQGEIPIPARIHDYLFVEESQISGRSIEKFIQSIGRNFRKWMRRWTGQEAAEQYRMIDEVLSFVESSLEMSHDDGKINPNKH
jgi:hypothetical protein